MKKRTYFKIIITLLAVFIGAVFIFAEGNFIKLVEPNSGWSSKRVITVKGRTNVSVKKVTVVYNGIPFYLPVNNEAFERKFVAAPGLNNIVAQVKTGNGIKTDKISFYSKAPKKAMKIFLTWDTDKTDIDLWVIEPGGEKCFYSHKNTKIGGSLDVDVTTGYGPEVYTLATPTKGAFKIQINYFSDNNQPQTEAKVYVVMYEGTPNESIKEYEAMLTKTKSVVTIDTITMDY